MEDNRKKKLKLNTLFGFLYQVVAIVCGFILPRMILSYYGSEINGLVNSIQSILNIITLMELGVGAVVQTALYKPLAENDEYRVSQIICAAKKYFRIVGIAFFVLVISISIVYPIMMLDKFEFFSTFMLIVAISITMFAQYFFGIVYNLLIQADQKVYVYNIIQIIALILNTLLCIIMMVNGLSIQFVKFTTAIVFLIRPLLLYMFVKKNYYLYKVQLNGDELPQKWNGIAQHIASYVLENTDIVVLTIFASLSIVSVYSVYYLVANSIRLLIVSLTNGVQSYYGNILALENSDYLKKEFNKTNFYINFISILVFSVSTVLITPFIMCYTKGLEDVNYNEFVFGALLILGQFFYCTRRSFNLLVLAAGHYKQTQKSAIIEAVINVVVSVSLVINFGLIGVAIGTAVAMLYRTTYFAWYCSKNIINRSIWYYLKDMIFNCIIYGIAFIVGLLYNTYIFIDDYFVWIGHALIISVSFTFVVCILSILFNHTQFSIFIKNLKNKIIR